MQTPIWIKALLRTHIHRQRKQEWFWAVLWFPELEITEITALKTASQITETPKCIRSEPDTCGCQYITVLKCPLTCDRIILFRNLHYYECSAISRVIDDLVDKHELPQHKHACIYFSRKSVLIDKTYDVYLIVGLPSYIPSFRGEFILN